MKLLNSILDFYIRSSLHVAVCFVALLQVISITGSYLIPDSLFIISFCAIIVGYNFIKYGYLFWNRKDFRFRYLILSITFICAIISIYFLSAENYKVWLIILLIGVIGLFYSIPLKNYKTLRQLPNLKILSVAICWVLLLFIIPAQSSFSLEAIFTDNYQFNDRIFYTHSLSMLLFIYALCIPFEIRDLKYDGIDLQTLPQKIGVQKTKIIGTILLAFSLIVHELGDYHSYFSSDLQVDWVFIIILITTAVAIWLSDKFKSDYFASFFVEAIPILWLGLICLF